MRVLQRLTLLLMIFLLVIPAAQAQEATPEPEAETPTSDVLQYGVPVEGEITASALTQTWTLENVAADRIDVRVERLNGTLVPDVTILDSSGQFLQSSYGADETEAVARIEDFYIPTAGTFQILVGRDGAVSGATLGAYQLVVNVRAVADTAPANSEMIGAVSDDAPVEGEITAEHWQHLYTLSADAAHWLRITVERVDGTLIPYFEVRNSSGGNITTGYPSADDASAQTDVILPNAGEFILMVTREGGFQGETTGQYRISIEILGSGEGSANLTSTPPEPIVYDTPDEGELTGVQWYRNYTLTVDAPDVIRLYVERVDGSLAPEISLQDSAGTSELTHAYLSRKGNTAEQFYTFVEPGTYTVQVLRSGGQGGGTAGGYRLLVELIGSGEGSPNLAPTSGAIISADKPVTGTLTNTRWMDTWTLEATEGQTLDISAERTEGTLIPHIVILDAAGNFVTELYSDSTFAVVRQENFYVPADGTYQVQVMRRDRARGATVGSYTLSVKPVQSQ